MNEAVYKYMLKYQKVLTCLTNYHLTALNINGVQISGNQELENDKSI